ncbi:microtubule associated protein-domain-containing protein [Cyathus striatus]|nr:microtubule associated protein-domain-containing protein [Cyathus striatus]
MSATSSGITALLNSLHTHLQSQTQLLPTLHAQLGLTPSALEDDLKALQRQLMESVEKQIELRQKEVDSWMERCDAIENECVRYTKALGGNMKVAGSSVGELRKELVLPKRFELVTEYQEKLRQIYHTKLEQLNTLTNRINTLARTLGSEYYAQEIMEPTPAIGELNNEPSIYRDVTPERFSKLEKELVKGKAEVSKRLNQLSTAFVQIDWLYTELGMIPPSLDDLRSSSSTHFSASTPSTSSRSSSADPFLFVSTPTPASRVKPLTPLLFRDCVSPTPESDYQLILARFMVCINEAEEEALQESSSVPMGLENVEPTTGLLEWANSLQASLEDTKRRREAHIQAMYDQLEGLWRRLGVEQHRGSTEDTVREYEEELERMLELKREKMGTFVESAREEIIRLWDDLLVGEEERADFAPFADDEYTEELLSIHEDEISKLKEERRMKGPLLASIKKYFEICGEEKELAAAASDQTRLLGRGPRDPGRLLREEKMRKRVSKEKPRLEQDLLASIALWEEEAGRPFLVHGESILQILVQNVSAADQENRKKPRAGSVPPRATTPVHLAQGYVPGTKTGVVTPAVRPGSTIGSHSMPNKRQKLGETVTVHHGTARTPGSVTNGHRAPLSSHRGANSNSLGMVRSASPTKIPTRTPSGSLRSGFEHTNIAMPVPKYGSQHNILGHSRAANTGGNAYARSTSGGYSRGPCTGSLGSSYGRSSSTVAKKTARAKRESFKPRPSVDAMDSKVSAGAASSKWRFTASVKEEDEEY